MSGGGEVVVAEELSRGFGSFMAVDRVSFRVREGEVFGFLGPNGAGKTTTIKMLTGLLVPSGGRASVAGHDLAGGSRAIREQIGYMSQAFSLYGDLTVEENIAFFAGLYGVARERQEERRDWVLTMAELGDARRRLTRELPLGFKQRLALGCAVLHEPPILFLDEPTSGVDPLSRRRFWELIYQLTEGGARAGGATTVFVTTHYMEEAEYCHRLALMNRGRLIALDTPAGLRRGMSEALFEVRVDRGVEAAEILATAPGIHHAGLFGRALHVTVEAPEKIETLLGAALGPAGIEVRSIERVVPSLEDVFISLVQAAGGAPVE